MKNISKNLQVRKIKLPNLPSLIYLNSKHIIYNQAWFWCIHSNFFFFFFGVFLAILWEASSTLEYLTKNSIEVDKLFYFTYKYRHITMSHIPMKSCRQAILLSVFPCHYAAKLGKITLTLKKIFFNIISKNLGKKIRERESEWTS